jgi:hypothetical protein
MPPHCIGRLQMIIMITGQPIVIAGTLKWYIQYSSSATPTMAMLHD